MGDGGLWEWPERHPRRTFAIIAVSAILLQLPFITMALNNDEGGFLFLAGQWDLDGTELYGNQWVDRPPLLLLILKGIAIVSDSGVAVRIAAMLFGWITLLAAYWAGHLINRTRGALVGTLTAAGIGVNYWLDGYQLTGETAAGAFGMLSCALTLAAWRVGHSTLQAHLLALAAGLLASCAFLVKQSFVDAALFAALLLLLHVRQAWRLLITGVVGIAIPLGLTAWWAASSWGPGFDALWDAVVDFRQDAADVLATSGLAATEERSSELIWLILITGIAAVVVWFVVAAVQLRPDWRLGTAIGLMLLYDVGAIWLGGSFWSHYLLGLIPPLALAAAFASRAPRPQPAAEWVACLVALCGIVSTAGGLVAIREDGDPRRYGPIIGEWLSDAARPDDTIFVAYGSPNLIQTSGLSAPYPYSWSLLIRVRDPELARLTQLLESPEAPTWIVEVGDFDWWELDTAEFTDVRGRRYSVVDTICGHDIYLRVDAPRELPATPSCD